MRSKTVLLSEACTGIYNVIRKDTIKHIEMTFSVYFPPNPFWEIYRLYLELNYPVNMSLAVRQIWHRCPVWTAICINKELLKKMG